MATKKTFSHSEISESSKNSHFNGEECFENKLKHVQTSLQQNIVYASELTIPQKSALTSETRFVDFYFLVKIENCESYIILDCFI